MKPPEINKKLYPFWSQPLEDQICASIRGGVSPSRAAQAFGIDYKTFRKWMANRPGFELAINTAAAQAALSAENRVWKDAPAVWLTKGPSRGVDGDWTDRVQIQAVASAPEVDYSQLNVDELKQLEALTIKALSPGNAEGASEEVAGEVLSVQRSDLPVSEAPDEVDRETGSGGEGDDS